MTNSSLYDDKNFLKKRVEELWLNIEHIDKHRALLMNQVLDLQAQIKQRIENEVSFKTQKTLF